MTIDWVKPICIEATDWQGELPAEVVRREGKWYRVYIDAPHKAWKEDCISKFGIRSFNAETGSWLNDDECIRVINCTSTDMGQQPSGADGSSYYDITLPNGVTVSCNDVIDALGLTFNRGEAFKALWRCGKKPTVPESYDLDKLYYYAKREKDRADNA